MILKINNLTVTQNNFLLLEKFNLEVSAGQIVFITGSNGCGKSSLLRSIINLQESSGEISLKYRNNELTEISHYCHYIGHRYAMEENLTVEENLIFWADFFKSSSFSLDKIITTLYLDKLLHLPFHQLSFGQKKRLSLSMLMLEKRPIWLLDEPFTGLDEKTIQLIKQILVDHLEKANGIILIASHLTFDYSNSIVINLENFKAC